MRHVETARAGGALSLPALALLVLAMVLGPVRWAPAQAGTTALDWSSIVTQVLPSVVNIASETLIDKNGTKQRQRDVGTGFLVDPSGTIVTNKHVIAGAFRITVTLQDGSRWPARLVAAADMIDLAVLKIDTGHAMPFLKFAEKGTTKVGDPVLVVGNPLGLGTSVSSGIVSAMHRNLMNTPFDDYVQTDAAINHGNSGGPMVNKNGQVVGVATILVTNSAGEGSNGLGFAISADTASYVVAHLLHPKASPVGWSGLHLQDASSGLQMAFHLPTLCGSLVTQVDPDSPAAKAGIQPGDVIMRVDDMVPPDARELLLDFVATRIGTVVPLQINRHGKTIKLTLTIEQWPGIDMAEQAIVSTMADAKAAQPPDLGLVLAPMTGAAARLFNLKADHGVVVAAVDPTSGAFTEGIKAGDVIQQVQDQPAISPDQVMTMINKVEAHQSFVALLVVDADGAKWVALYSGKVASAGHAPDAIAETAPAANGPPRAQAAAHEP